MNTTFAFARSSAKAHRSSLIGGFITLFLAALLLSATGAWIQAGTELSGGEGAFGTGELLGLTTSFSGTTVIIVIFIVASVFTQALRPRARELALLRTIGATPKQISSLVTGEMLFVFLGSAPLGIVAGSLLAPALSPALEATGLTPPGFSPSFSLTADLVVLAVLAATVLVSSQLALRSVTRASAAESSRASAVDAATIGRPRVIAALLLTSLGIVSACVPFALGGMAGSAGAAGSAILFVIAAALAGPVLVKGAAQAAERVAQGRGSAVFTLAVRAARGYSRRLTGAIVPLALLFALGIVQIGSGAIVARAGQDQLAEALHANIIVDTAGTTDAAGTAGATDADDSTNTAGASEAADSPDAAGATIGRDLASVKSIPGVKTVGMTGQIRASVRTDNDEPSGIDFFDDLSWESTALTVFAGEDLISPQVRKGSLSELDQENTIAVSTSADPTLTNSIGETIKVEVGDDQVVDARIVATYDGGAAFGNYLVGSNFAGSETIANQEWLISTQEGAEADVIRRLHEIGLAPVTSTDYVKDVAAGTADEESLSNGASLILLVFIGLAAANTLVMITRSRGREFQLLRRAGITTEQLLGTSIMEGLIVGLTAVCVGAISAFPALFGISWSMLGTVSIGVAPIVLLTFVAVVVGLSLGSVVLATFRTDHGRLAGAVG